MRNNAKHYQSLVVHEESNIRRTDYIVIKIYEAIILGDDKRAEELKEKYREQLIERESIREKIRKYEWLRDEELATEI